MNAPTVDTSLDAQHLRENLQKALDKIAAIATVVGEVPLSETFRSRHLRDIAEQFADIGATLTSLASDDIPF